MLLDTYLHNTYLCVSVYTEFNKCIYGVLGCIRLFLYLWGGGGEGESRERRRRERNKGFVVLVEVGLKRLNCEFESRREWGTKGYMVMIQGKRRVLQKRCPGFFFSSFFFFFPFLFFSFLLFSFLLFSFLLFSFQFFSFLFLSLFRFSSFLYPI